MKMRCVSLARIGMVGVLLLAGLALATPTAAPGGNGTSILHFFVRKAMSNLGVAPGATGRVDAKQNQQGNANNQQLDVILKGLPTNTTFRLLAVVDDDTNYTAVADFATDTKGAASLLYRKVGSSQGQGQGLGKGKSPLPSALDPLCEVRELAVLNASTQLVLVADLTAPDKLQYLIKRALDNEGTDPDAAAAMILKATVSQTRLDLKAVNLNTNADYYLALNEGIVRASRSDAKGRLQIKGSLVTPLQVLDIREIALLDAATNTVLSTELP